MTGIYSITNTINGKRYIGQSKDIYKRWGKHKSELRNNKHANQHLQTAWNKYGEGCFLFEILEECSVDNLDTLEKQYIAKYKANDRDFGYCYEDGGHLNKICSKETRAKISKKLMYHPVSEEIIQKLKSSHVGKHLSEEAKKKLSEFNKGKKLTEDHKAKISASNKGKKLSEEHKAKLSASHMGHKWSEETRQKVKGTRSGVNSPCYGKHLSEETKKKLSASLKGRSVWNKGIPCSEAQKKRISEVNKGKAAPNRRAVKNMDTDEIYCSVKEAKECTGITHIDQCARGERKTAGGYRWCYIELYKAA